MELVADAICAGIFNDLGSGSNVDLCIITKVQFVLFLSLMSGGEVSCYSHSSSFPGYYCRAGQSTSVTTGGPTLAVMYTQKATPSLRDIPVSCIIRFSICLRDEFLKYD